MSETLKYLLPFLGIASLVTFFISRHYTRRDKHEELRVAAYRAVLASVSDLRAAMERLNSEFDFNQEPRPGDFTETNQLQVKTTDLIERNRADTGHAFADAAKFVLDYWENETHIMWERDYEAKPIVPTLEERELALYDAIPIAYRKKVAPGHFEETKRGATAAGGPR